MQGQSRIAHHSMALAEAKRVDLEYRGSAAGFTMRKSRVKLFDSAGESGQYASACKGQLAWSDESSPQVQFEHGIGLLVGN